MADFPIETASFQTILDFIRYGISLANKSDLYYGHGTDNAFDDIQALILGSLDLPFDVDDSFLNARLSETEKKDLTEKLKKRLIDKLPVPYLTNKAYFCDLEFYVDNRVLIPRSPIAELIKQQFSPWIEAENVEAILDLCTGSACIAIAAAMYFPWAEVDASDISKDALAVAAINCKKHGLEGDLNLIESDCFDKVPAKKYDLIISNPPYVGYEEMQTLPEEYNHEPKLALETENNGLAIVEKILAKAHDYLNDGGILVVEVGNSEEALCEHFSDLAFTWLDFEQGGQGVFLLTKDQLKAHFKA
ncbi:MAG: 50S ribosomal protein L3 N(5)-glutamine methyltransferase [Proteobacteria bacterium]|nr:50S ribosomal protein L3 N(5)-glutamine methyltransferase [Pseudomonadota bacterium]